MAKNLKRYWEKRPIDRGKQHSFAIIINIQELLKKTFAIVGFIVFAIAA
jgi:hypothetical protein